MLQIILEPSLSFIPHILKNILKIFLNDQIRHALKTFYRVQVTLQINLLIIGSKNSLMTCLYQEGLQRHLF